METTVTCPSCRQCRLHVLSDIELGPDAQSDEKNLQTLMCDSCDFVGVALYEENRRGPLDQESWRYVGWRTSREVFAELEQAIRACPDPADEHCPCTAHRRYGERSVFGTMEPLQLIATIDHPFPLDVLRD